MKAVTKRGVVAIGDAKFDVFVLENEMRVCTQRTLVRALGGSGGNLQRPLGKKTAGEVDLGDPIKFETLDGIQALGRQVGDIGKLCAQIIDAHINGSLPADRIDLARAANRLNGALANVALEALVDEATGYQAFREGEYLRRRLQAFLRDDADRWQRRFGRGLVTELSRLYGHAYDGGRLPRFLSSIFDKLYRLVLGEDVADALKERNPQPRWGSNHHQHLTDGVQTLLETDLTVIEAMARTSGSPEEFWSRLSAHFHRSPLQLGFWTRGDA
jgi:hypothetical protein